MSAVLLSLMPPTHTHAPPAIAAPCTRQSLWRMSGRAGDRSACHESGKLTVLDPSRLTHTEEEEEDHRPELLLLRFKLDLLFIDRLPKHMSLTRHSRNGGDEVKASIDFQFQSRLLVLGIGHRRPAAALLEGEDNEPEDRSCVFESRRPGWFVSSFKERLRTCPSSVTHL